MSQDVGAAFRSCRPCCRPRLSAATQGTADFLAKLETAFACQPAPQRLWDSCRLEQINANLEVIKRIVEPVRRLPTDLMYYDAASLRAG